jgi:hypothetical protein
MLCDIVLTKWPDQFAESVEAVYVRCLAVCLGSSESGRRKNSLAALWVPLLATAPSPRLSYSCLLVPGMKLWREGRSLIECGAERLGGIIK